MPTKYTVSVPEVHYTIYTVIADNEDDAIQLLKDGEGEMSDGSTEFSHILNDGEFTVMDEEDVDDEDSDDDEMDEDEEEGEDSDDDEEDYDEDEDSEEDE